VDSVIGSNQTVIKSLSSIYEHVKEISGATVMGDGSVGLVLDIEQLVKIVELEN
jgi:two-component system, chemotaxis family, sensor kinase CheA